MSDGENRPIDRPWMTQTRLERELMYEPDYLQEVIDRAEEVEDALNRLPETINSGSVIEEFTEYERGYIAAISEAACWKENKNE